jgi:hypothetical protein
MRTGYESSVADFAIVQQFCNIIGFVIRLLRGGRMPIPSLVVSDGMELLTEGGQYVIPDCRIRYPIMEQDHRLRPIASLLVIEP